jgi:hypothetical protein
MVNDVTGESHFVRRGDHRSAVFGELPKAAVSN